MTSTNRTANDGQPVEYRQERFRVPAGATELLLIRHGASAPARVDRSFPLVDGHGDPELAPDGRHQAECVARRLATTRIDAVYVTTLRRTAETAAPLAAPPRAEAPTAATMDPTSAYFAWRTIRQKMNIPMKRNERRRARVRRCTGCGALGEPGAKT